MELLLIIIGLVVISYAVWRYNSRQLDKPRKRWDDFKKRTEDNRRDHSK